MCLPLGLAEDYCMGGRWVVQGVALSLQEVSGFEVSSESKQVSDWLLGSVRPMSGWVAEGKDMPSTHRLMPVMSLPG